MRKGPPISIENSFITESHFVASDPVDDAIAKMKIVTPAEDTIIATANGGPHKDNPRNWLCRVTVKNKEDAKPPLHWKIHVVMAAIFTVDAEYPGSVENLVMVTGASIIYGAIREHVLAVTSRGPFAGVLLPSTAFGLDPKGQTRSLKSKPEPEPKPV